MDLLALLILAIAISLDSFSVGATYGLRNVYIPPKSIIIISLCTFGMLLVAMTIGQGFEYFISQQMSKKIGGFILIGIGLWVLIQFFRKTDNNPKTTSNTIIKLEIKSLGIIIKILKKPMEADIDRSGTISGIEAFLLGFALSLDAFGAGLGAALIDLSPIIFAILVTSCSSLFLITGIKFGQIFQNVEWIHKLAFLPGIVLIFLGIFKI
ncbi:sporulation membrane protein YtaF [Bacillus sp. Marseille-P3661]|uniref:sporulation membrane protein YtaF n=1 Tax=Bacillus sp. Marseille-P3661 TaxID=1936234 RepID=UPI000C8335FB|nr:sporulation membrane protein YtaF [Bacillus sp. Marseille-P3661]